MTIGYKATYNYKCRGQLYEIGQEYKIYEKPILCEKGFHYCKKAKDVLIYYAMHEKGFKLLEIEDLSPDTISDVNKSCSNHIKILREISDPDEIMFLLGKNSTCDETIGKVTIKYLNGSWEEYTYNEFDKILIFKNSYGAWYKNTYNESGQKLTFEASFGHWYKYTYNEFGQRLTYEDRTGYYVYKKD